MASLRISILISLSVFLFSCEDSERYEEIAGHWVCVSWTSELDNQNRCKNDVYFNFNEDRTYTSKLGSDKDTGTYKIARSALTVSPEGKMEIRVDIQKLTNDSLKFLMNAGGIEETMILVNK